MTWVKIDDQFTDHPKVVEAGPLASWLYVCGLTYCARYLTDGHIPARQVRRLADLEGTDELAERLVAVGLWERRDDGFQVHDWADYNPSADETRTLREKRAEAGRLGGSTRRRHIHEANPEASAKQTLGGLPRALTKQNPTPYPYPYPSPLHTDQTDQTPVVGGSAVAPPSPPSQELDGLVQGLRGLRGWTAVCPPDKTRQKAEAWQRRYPGLDLLDEVRRMDSWLLGKPKSAGNPAFVENWLKKSELGEGDVQNTRQSNGRHPSDKAADREVRPARDLGQYAGIVVESSDPRLLNVPGQRPGEWRLAEPERERPDLPGEGVP